MIIVNLKGGLGNQMFQYALGRSLSLKNGDTLKLDTTSLSKAKELGNIYRPFDLDAFSIEKNLATKSEVSDIKHTQSLATKLYDLFSRKFIKNNHVVFEPEVLSLQDNQYLDGYWQSTLFFTDIRETLLSDFTLLEALKESGKALQERIQATNSVSIHIRRGDYVQNPRVLHENGICSVSYYKKAIAEIEITQSNIEYFVFSDDIDWVKSNLNFNGNNVKYVEDVTLTAPQELYLMSQCKHNIIANSSFSWWAAWLNQNPEKMVIAPNPWFDTIEYDKHLIPSTWKLLPKN